jgi:hypothetical protein
MKTNQIEQRHARRDFLKTSAFVSAAGLSANTALATEIFTSPVSDTSCDCYQLGFVLGENLAKQAGTSASPLQMHYSDSAGTTVDSLRIGLVDGIIKQSGNRPLWSETQGYQAGVLGTASLHNLSTGTTARFEIPTVALSHLELNRSSQDAIDFIATKLV